MVGGESGEVGNPGTLGMTKRRGLLKGKGPLPRDRAVVGRRGRLFHRHPPFPRQQPFLCESKKVTGSQRTWAEKDGAQPYERFS